MILKILLSIIFLQLLILLSKSECPPPEDTFPFDCNLNGNNNSKILRLQHSHVHEINITQVALKISEYYGNRTEEKHFHLINFEDPFIKQFPENCLLDLSFEQIWLLGTNKVERIHENAFNSSMHTLKVLIILHELHLILESPDNIFKLINSMVNLEILSLTVPHEYELKEKSINNAKLKDIFLQRVNKVNNNVFYGLKNLNFIRIEGNFDYIPSNAFDINNHNTSIDLHIGVETSKINGSSFGSNVFTNANRTLHISFFGDIYLQTLMENTFGELLNKYPKSTIESKLIAYNCKDCDFKWIFERKAQLISQIKGAECYDGRYFYNLTTNDFNHCSSIKKRNVAACILVPLFVIGVIVGILWYYRTSIKIWYYSKFSNDGIVLPHASYGGTN